VEEKKERKLDEASIVLFTALFIVIIYFIGICKTFTDIIYVIFGSIFMFAVIVILYKMDKKQI
jgi:cbb3-type cytochrome oxidase subunit 3